MILKQFRCHAQQAHCSHLILINSELFNGISVRRCLIDKYNNVTTTRNSRPL